MKGRENELDGELPVEMERCCVTEGWVAVMVAVIPC
jgi:hypothetical protein